MWKLNGQYKCEGCLFVQETIMWGEGFVVKGCDNKICDLYGGKCPMESSTEWMAKQ